MCNKCERYLCLWNRIFNLITYYENVIILNSCLCDNKVKAIKNTISMLEQKKKLVEKILSDLNCPGFASTSFSEAKAESVTDKTNVTTAKGGAK